MTSRLQTRCVSVRHREHARHLAIALVAFASSSSLMSGCLIVPGDVPSGTRLACTKTEECPPTWACQDVVGRCFPIVQDGDAPTFVDGPVVTPSRVSLVAGHDTYAVTFTVDAADALDSVEVVVGTRRLACETEDEKTFRCEDTLPPEATEGPRTVAVLVVDVEGRVAVGESLLLVDLTAPSLVDPFGAVSPEAARLGESVIVRAFFSEPLTSSPSLQAVSSDVGTPSLSFGTAPASDGIATYVRTVGEGEDGAYTFVLDDVTDIAGNRAEGLTFGTLAVDASPPEIENIVLSRTKVSATPGKNVVEVRATIAERIEDEGGSIVAVAGTLAFTCVRTDDDVTCTAEVPPLVDNDPRAGTEEGVLVVIEARDAAGNASVKNAHLTLDHAPPKVSTAFVAITPSSSSVISLVTSAGPSAVINVTIISDEALDTETSPTLSATFGGSTIDFTLVEGTFTAGGASFRATTPQTALDGTYVPHLVMADVAGNVTSALDVAFVSPEINIKTSVSTLVVAQDDVRFVRSPWGLEYAASEDGVSDPVGTFFMLGPTTAGLVGPPLSTFTFADGKHVRAIRVFADVEKVVFLGTLFPLNDTWPRQALLNFDTPAAYVTGVDDAGIETAPLLIENVEWRMAPNPDDIEALPFTAYSIPSSDDGRDGGSRQRLALDEARELTIANGIGRTSTSRSRFFPVSIPGDRPDQIGFGAAAFARNRTETILVTDDYGTPASSHVWRFDGVQFAEINDDQGLLGRRDLHRAVYDSWRGAVLVFGGIESSGQDGMLAVTTSDDVVRVDSPVSMGPQGVRDFAMSFDPTSGDVVIVTGTEVNENVTVPLEGTWRFTSLGDWIHDDDAPPVRRGAAMAYDAERDVHVMFGGCGFQGQGNCQDNADPFFDDVWEWTAASGWSEIGSGQAGPGARANGVFVFDDVRQSLVLVGGMKRESGVVCPTHGLAAEFETCSNTDLWAFDGVTWSLIDDGATQVAHRYFPFATYDALHDEILIGGGIDPELPLDDVAAHRGAFVRVGDVADDEGPGAIEALTVSYDAGRQRLVVFGAENAQQRHRVMEWDGSTWTTKFPDQPRPFWTTLSSTAYDSTRGVTFFHDTTNGGAADFWSWDGTAWTELAPAVGPSWRNSTTMVVDEARGTLLVIGGQAPVSGLFLSDIWEWNGATWTLVSEGEIEPARDYSATFDADLGAVWIGLGAAETGTTSAIYRWDGVTLTTTTLQETLPSAEVTKSGTLLKVPGGELFAFPRGPEVMSHSSFALRNGAFERIGFSGDLSDNPSTRTSSIVYWNPTTSSIEQYVDDENGSVWRYGPLFGGRPAMQIDVDLSLMGAPASLVNYVEFRGACGANTTTENGAVVEVWSNKGGESKTGAFVLGASTDAGLDDVYEPSPLVGAGLFSVVYDDDDARALTSVLDPTVSVRCRTAVTDTTAVVGMDTMEVRVRYRHPSP